MNPSRMPERSEERTEKLRAALVRRQPTLTVILENIHDPHNVSAILRSCDAVGVLETQLLYTYEKFPTLGERSSASARKWVETLQHTSIEECYSALRNRGFAIYVADIGSGEKYFDVDFTKPTAVLFGNEHRGPSDEAIRLADGIVSIPMMGIVESLNVSVAAATMLFEAMRQRISCRMYDSPQLGHEEFEKKLKGWLLK